MVWRAVRSMARGQVFTEHFLMSIATIGAFVIREYAEGVAVMLFYLAGEFLEDKAVGRSRRSISALSDIRPEYANLSLGNELKRVAPQEVRVGDEIVIKPGERVPLDGRVTKGSALVATSALTGESLPRFMEPGVEALSGFVNQNGVLTLEVTKSYEMSTMSKILELMENVSSRKAPTETLMAKFARVYTPVVVLSALALALIHLMQSQGIACGSDGIRGTVVHVAIDGACAGHLVITDEIKEDAAQTIRSLKALGIKRTLMFSGDLQQVGEETGRLLDLDKVYINLLPGDKVALMETLIGEKSGKGKVVFVGDGINDAPVLARADVGIAMGALGSDAAIEAADVADEPSKVVTAIRIAVKTRRIVYQNIIFALGVKALFLALGAAGVTTMWAAVFGDMGVALIAIMNSLRALNTKNL